MWRCTAPYFWFSRRISHSRSLSLPPSYPTEKSEGEKGWREWGGKKKRRQDGYGDRDQEETAQWRSRRKRGWWRTGRGEQMESGLSQGSSKTVGRAEKKLELTSTNTRQRANTNTGGYRNTQRPYRKTWAHTFFFHHFKGVRFWGRVARTQKKRERNSDTPTHCAGIYKPNGIFQFQFDSLLFKSLILTLTPPPFPGIIWFQFSQYPDKKHNIHTVSSVTVFTPAWAFSGRLISSTPCKQESLSLWSG